MHMRNENQLLFLCMGILVGFSRRTLALATPILRPSVYSSLRVQPLSSGSFLANVGAWRGGALFGKPAEDDGGKTLWSDPQEQSQSSSEASKVQTGWLHSTKSRSERELEEFARQQSEGTSGSPPVENSARLRLERAMMEDTRNHRIVAPPAFHACGNGRQLVVTDHRISVPVFRAVEGSKRIDIAFTICEEIKNEQTYAWFQSLSAVSSRKRAQQYIEKADLQDADKAMLYLQGGPGFGAPTPVSGISLAKEGSWAGAALGTYSRIVLMDQRGTGRSAPITKQSLEKLFPELFLFDGQKGTTLEEMKEVNPTDYERFESALNDATEYMAQFRADNIVHDAEAIKEAILLPPPLGMEPESKPWGCALGQSFGGFCMMTYLSFIERPPQVCLLTGGIAPMLTPAYDAYSSLWQRVKDRSLLYYDMYPGDVPLVKKIVKQLLEQPEKLPSGGTLTARRFLQLGLSLGGSPSSFASMHGLFNSAFLDEEGAEFTRAFLKQIDMQQPFDDHPLYFWMHESIYGDGSDQSPTNWAAHRSYEDLAKANPEFDYRVATESEADEQPVLFFGEMVFPWMAEDFAECGGLGLTAMSNKLAAKSDWPKLYDAEHMKKVLADRTSRAAAAVYHGDMYVDFDCCMEVTKRGGPLEKCKLYVTNEYQHSGLRDSGAAIFDKIHGMANGNIRTPS